MDTQRFTSPHQVCHWLREELSSIGKDDFRAIWRTLESDELLTQLLKFKNLDEYDPNADRDDKDYEDDKHDFLAQARKYVDLIRNRSVIGPPTSSEAVQGLEINGFYPRPPDEVNNGPQNSGDDWDGFLERWKEKQRVRVIDDYLSQGELDHAELISEYTAYRAAEHNHVKKYRSRCGFNELTPQKAYDFLTSPALGHLPSSVFEENEIPILNHTSEILSTERDR